MWAVVSMLRMCVIRRLNVNACVEHVLGEIQKSSCVKLFLEL